MTNWPCHETLRNRLSPAKHVTPILLSVSVNVEIFVQVRYYDNLPLEGDEEEEGGEQLEMGESEKAGVEMRK